MHSQTETQEIVDKYTCCMQEIKNRIKVIHSIICGEIKTLYLQTNSEFLCLQLRKILELIALANLVANSDEYKKMRENFSKDWNAKRIVEQIKKINSRYFPRAVISIENKDGVKLVDKKENILTEDLFITIYNETSCLLHAQNPFDEDKINLEQIQLKIHNYICLITNTLSQHILILCNNEMVHCIMNAIDRNSPQKEGKICVWYRKKLTNEEQEINK